MMHRKLRIAFWFIPALCAYLLILSTSMIAQASEDTSAANPSAQQSQEDFGDIRTPRYTRMRPSWGFQFSGSMAALGTQGNQSTIPNIGSHHISGYRLAYEYEPPFLQKFGVFSIGPSVSFCMVSKTTGISDARVPFWSAGGKIQYQARFFRMQPIVPFAGISVEQLSYHLRKGAGSTTMISPFFGGMIFLNAIEPSAAADFYAGMGVLRTYLVAEMRMDSAKTNDINLKGSSVFAGIRIEH